MKWRFWEPEEQEPEKIYMDKTFTLSIDVGNRIKSWTLRDNETTSGFEAFREFYKWYFCRKQSSEYVIEHRTGFEMVRRDTIKSFKVETKWEHRRAKGGRGKAYFWDKYTSLRQDVEELC